MVNENLIKRLISLGILVSKTLQLSIQSIEKRDLNLAEAIIEKNEQINQMAVDLEENCLKILALFQPVAIDLRFVVTVLKINNDLEKIGNLTARIAEEGKHISRDKNVTIPADIFKLSKKVEIMVEDCIFCFVQMDINSAKKICLADCHVNLIHKQSYEKVKRAILIDLVNYDSYQSSLSISKHLERIGDLATNIAEDICFMLSGKIIRHKNLEYEKVG